MEQIHRISQVAEKLGVSTPTVRIWERKGLIPKASRHPNGRRFYSQKDMEVIRNWWLKSKTK
jgi:DNA-binding transcriptional MerR regulator